MANACVQEGVRRLKVGGVSLPLRSAHAAGVLDSLAQSVNSKIEEARSVRGVSFQHAVLLSALRLAEDNLALKKSLKRYKQESLRELACIEAQLTGALGALRQPVAVNAAPDGASKKTNPKNHNT